MNYGKIISIRNVGGGANLSSKITSTDKAEVKRNFYAKYFGFTLAEVLITLGIIGVVAALTLPALIANHNKKVVETRLEKFYSAINQAITRAEVDYGPREFWFEDNVDLTLKKTWVDKYIVPYMNVTKTDFLNIAGTSCYTLYFSDGSAVSIVSTNGRDWYFFPGDPESCFSYAKSEYAKYYMGRCAFTFYYNPVRKADGSYYQYNFEPYMSGWDKTESSLKNHSTYGCNETSTWPAYCTRWIQYNGWKIPDEYPFRVNAR